MLEKENQKSEKFSMKLANRSSDLNIWPLTDFETAMAVILERRVEITTRRLMGNSQCKQFFSLVIAVWRIVSKRELQILIKRKTNWKISDKT